MTYLPMFFSKLVPITKKKNLQVALPAETTTGTCFLQYYIESILALQEDSCRLTQGLLLPNAYRHVKSRDCFGCYLGNLLSAFFVICHGPCFIIQ
jgi:hypothetical protein